MSPSTQIKFAVVAWCLIEAALFALLVHAFGLVPVCVFEFATGLFGLWLLKRKGRAAMITLRQRFRGRESGARADLIGDGLSLLGAVSLTLPGFLSDVVALCLLVPALRSRIAPLLLRKGRAWRKAGAGSNGGLFARVASPRASADGRRAPTIDLEPGEWRGGDARRP